VILYRLVCAEGHEFESWFRDSAAYDSQIAQGAVSCPFCHTTQVSKAIMAPHVARGGRESEGRPVALLDESHAALRQMIRELREKIAASTEDVGEKFPNEARRMQDGASETRAIRGRASLEKAKALLDEGIEILPIPGLPDENH
jgi:hypothetical protein